MDIQYAIRQLRESEDLTQEEFGAIAGVSSMAVSQWENGRAMPRMGALQKIADHFGLSKSDIIEGNCIPAPAGRVEYAVTGITAPVYGHIAAGDPLEMIPFQEEAYLIPPIAEKHPDGFFLIVRGDSMDRIMPTGSLVYIDPHCEVRSGDVAAVNVNGDDATLKRIFFADGTVVLHPESTNPVHHDRTIDENDPDAPRFRILGKAVWHYLLHDERL